MGPKRSNRSKRSKRSPKKVSVCDGKAKCNKKYYGSNVQRCCKTTKQYKSIPRDQLRFVRMGCCKNKKVPKK